jgi:hypothetical protein
VSAKRDISALAQMGTLYDSIHPLVPTSPLLQARTIAAESLKLWPGDGPPGILIFDK